MQTARKVKRLPAAVMAVAVMLGLGLGMAAAPVHAEFTPPREIVHEGVVYTLAFQNLSPNRLSLEYTHNGESVENWSKLVTIQHFPGKLFTPMEYLQAMNQALNSETPVPHFLLYLNGGHGYSRIIYEPDDKNPWFESDVHKSFHRPECAGRVVYLYAVKYPPPQAGEDKQALLRDILAENELQAKAMQQSGWQPDCS